MATPIVRDWLPQYDAGSWEEGDFHLDTYHTETYDRRDCEYFGYRFYHQGKLIFSGEDYSPGPLVCAGTWEFYAGIMGFLALRPGDTDDEYFDGYTPEQMAFAQGYGEELSCILCDMGERPKS